MIYLSHQNMSNVPGNISELNDRIKAACERSKRKADDIKLVAVTKTASIGQIEEAIACGQKDFGENKLQAAEEKLLHFKDKPFLNWHMIGHLQTNKVKNVIGNFSLIHSLDSFHLAKEIDKRAAEKGIIAKTLIEVNVSGEKSKFGIKPEEISALLSEVSKLPNIKVEGLMTMAPFSENPENSRPYFKKLFRLAEENGLKELSMGMSGDFEVAIEEGSTIIRIGQAIFG